MKRILVYGMTDNLGGIETFMLSYINAMKDYDIQFDFIAPYSHISIEKEVVALGGKVYHLPSRRTHYKEYHCKFKEIMLNHANEYTAVWLNDCMFCNLDILKYAKKCGIKTRIVHAHNSDALGNKLRILRHNINKHVLKKYATHFWACSDLAAQWSYPGTIKKKKMYTVIPNAINTEVYRFIFEKRQEIREKLQLKDKFVVGNVGRLDYQKNQEFMIDIFAYIIRKNPKALLLLVGTGEDENKIKEKVITLGLEEKVKMLGIRKDVPDLLQAMDVFLMPSRFEGLGIVAIEAQTAGLPCVMSNVIPKETAVTEHAVYLGLDIPAENWADKVLEFQDFSRKDERDSVKAHGFDISVAAESLWNVFNSICV